MKTRLTTALLGIAASTLMASASLAQISDDPGHPRVNQVDQRLNDQQQRIDNNVANGTMTPAQAGHDEARDAKIQQKAAADEAKNGGHLTKKEQRRLTKKLNKNSKAIHRQQAKAVNNQ